MLFDGVMVVDVFVVYGVCLLYVVVLNGNFVVCM